jgi:hypothetical protein
MKTYLSLAVLLCLSLAGCKSPRISRDLTSGQIGCSPGEISIRNETAGISGTHTWTAVCHGKEYICNYHTTTGSRCTPRQQQDVANVAATPWYQTSQPSTAATEGK